MDTSSSGTTQAIAISLITRFVSSLHNHLTTPEYMLSVLKSRTNNSSRGSSSIILEDSTVNFTAASSYQKQQQQQAAQAKKHGVRPSLARTKGFRHHRRSNALYDWRQFAPKNAGWRPWKYVLRWCIVGGAGNAAESSEDRVDNLSGLAECLTLLRLYLELYGIPAQGGIKDQEMVLRETILKDLYKGATPLEYIPSTLKTGIFYHS